MTEVAERAVPAIATSRTRRSAIADLFHYRQLVAMLVVRELKVRYKRSLLGMLWTMLNPLLLMAVYTVVFATIMRSPQRNFALFLLSGLLPWLFFSTAILQGLTSILTNQELIRKVRLPQAVFPLSVVGSNLVNFALSLFPLFLLMAVVRQPFTPALLFLPAGIFVLALFTSGVTLLFSTFTVFFRDVRHLTEVLLQMLLYLSPVLYDQQLLGERSEWWFRAFNLFLRLNPLTYLLPLFRDPVYYGRLPSLPVLAIASLESALMLAVGFLVFHRLAPRHVHYL
ncbi:MAG TPA: ABC transporter permease [Myxococcales bacterium]|nr:ABC transporter permease [Myxococcales bacterium]